jgi:addiction module HigA family antidote
VGQFASAGLDRKCWRGSAAVRKIFRDAFESAGLPNSNPHAFRNMLARFGEQTCRTPEDFKAFSQNIGHDKVLTTFTSYGEVPTERQADIVRRRRDVSAGPAIRLGRYFGVDRRFWLNLQAAHDLSRAEREKDHSRVHSRADARPELSRADKIWRL